MKNIFSLPVSALFLFCFIQKAFGQEGGLKRCGTMEYYKAVFQTNPAFKIQFQKNQAQLNKEFTTNASRLAAASDTIPVVVHVVASAAIQQQVTDAIIQSQIDVLNEDYKGLNADSVRIPAAFKPLFGKSNLNFKRAGTSPLGEPTNGIIRITTNTTYNQSTFDNAKLTSAGGDDAWDPNRYLNIWVVSFGNSGVLGISVFPGDPRLLPLHGFVCDYRAFGRGASYLYSSYNKGRTTTHELGHFFNLFHIWGDDDGACTGTDFPGDAANDDTPNQANATNGNPDPQGIGVVKTDACSPTPPGIMYQNFMDYTDDEALVLFTKGQQKRIENTLTLSPDRSSLLFSTAYLTAPSFTYDARIRRIVAPTSPQCNSTFTPSVILRNSGTAALTSVKILSVLNNQQPVVYNWTGNLSSYTETQVTLPALTGVTGANHLSIYTNQPNGAVDENPANDTATLSFNILGVTPITRVDEGFDSPQFPPTNWKVMNPDDDLTWQRNASVGKNALGCAWFNDWNNFTFNRYDDLVTPPFSFSSVDSVFLYFNLAAALRTNNGFTNTDTLSVLISKDCGNSFTPVYKKWGMDLQTLSTTLNTEFFPMDDEWRRDSVNLGTVLASTENQFQVYFRICGNHQNNVFLDDISLVTQKLPETLKTKGYLILPTNFQNQFSIWHYHPPVSLRYVNIYNAQGQLVWSRPFNNNAQTFITVNLTGQPAGMYFVKLGYQNSRQNVTQKVIKQR